MGARASAARYDYMVVLDADSLMTGETLVRLAAAMERDPEVGLIQTFPIMVNATTLFARLQQFAGRVYGPLIAQGLAWWHGADSNYWGHNAIIRTRAFAGHAGLPMLSGPRPFGGHILSHDFVEAALMRRGGLGRPHGARRSAARTRKAALAHRVRGARPALVPGQSAASGRAAGARPALVEPPASVDRHRLLCGVAAVADVSLRRHADRAAGAVHPP